MAISLVSGGNLSSSDTTGSDIVITLPTLAQNDYVYVAAFRRADQTAPAISTSGYGSAIATKTQGSGSTGIILSVFRKKMGASPDSSVTITGDGASVVAQGAVVMCLRGVDTTTPEDATPTTTGAASTNPDAPSITTVTDNAMVLPFAVSRVQDTSITVPTGYSDLTSSTTPASTVAACDKIVSPAGAEDPAAYTTWVTGTWAAITVAVRPAASGPVGDNSAFVMQATKRASFY